MGIEKLKELLARAKKISKGHEKDDAVTQAMARGIEMGIEYSINILEEPDTEVKTKQITTDLFTEIERRSDT